MLNNVEYYDIWLDVEPKRIKVQESTEKLSKANAELAIVREQVTVLFCYFWFFCTASSIPYYTCTRKER